MLDITLGSLALALLWPLLLAAMLAVRMEGPGPVIFRQQRVGRNGRVFVMLKLRSMHPGTPEAATHDVAAGAVTRFGRFARRFKVDELPQIINVLKGDMSLVGPRPCLVSQVDLVEARRREGVLDVLPGVTGLGQVLGVDMSRPDMLVRVDRRYVHGMSVCSDLRILSATLWGCGRGDPAMD